MESSRLLVVARGFEGCLGKADSARAARNDSRERGPESPVEPVVVGRVGEPAVDAVHREVNFTRAITAAVNREIRDLARWLELDLMHARG